MFAIPDRTLRDLGFEKLLEALAARTATTLGREKALALPFLDRRDEIETSLARVAEARALLQGELPLPLAGAEDVRVPLAIAAKGGVLEPADMVACARAMRAAARVRGHLLPRKQLAPILAEAASALPELTSLAGRIESAFEPSGRLKDSASAMLGSLRDRARQLHHDIKEKLEEKLRDERFSMNLRESYISIRNDRYVVPVNSQFQAQIPGIVHNASNTGQTIFVEPDFLVPLGNELTVAESLVAEEERRILAELSGDLGERAGELLGALVVLGELDLAEASGRLAEDLKAVAPTLGDGRTGFSLRAARHPLLVLGGRKVVPNDVSLAPGQRALVVSGPNAGGKTVTISAVGLCALLVRVGLPIPADEGSVVPLFGNVHTAIGDAQDLSKGLSTFSAHLAELRRILETAREASLVLVDEIAADTDPREGAALAAAVLHELVARGAQVLVTTHLEELKALGLSDERFANARVGLDPTTLSPTFRLQLGAAGASSALEIAARAGLPESVLQRARENLHGGSALAKALARLDEERQALELERARLSEERASAERANAELARLRGEAEAARREAEARVRAELAEEVERARAEVGELVAKLAASPNMTEAVRAQGQLKQRAEEHARDAARLAAGSAAAREAAATAAPLPLRVLPGSRVKVISLGKEAEVVEVSADDALVAVGSMKSRVKLADLAVLAGKARGLPVGPPGKKGKRLDLASAAAPGAAAEPEARCDLRGLRAEDALREVEQFLDRKYTEGAATVSILHGHGTGALKKAIREALAGSPYVAASRPGAGHEGGDGVTIVSLRG